MPELPIGVSMAGDFPVELELDLDEDFSGIEEKGDTKDKGHRYDGQNQLAVDSK